MTEMQQVTERIAQFKQMTEAQTKILGAADPNGTIEENIREEAIIDVLSRLLECRDRGMSLDDAITYLDEKL